MVHLGDEISIHGTWKMNRTKLKSVSWISDDETKNSRLKGKPLTV